MNVDMEDNRARLPRYFTLEMLMSVMVALSGLVLIWNLVSPVVSVLALFIAGTVFTLSITVLIRLLMDPDSVRARQSSNVLQLASQTLEAMGEEGLDSKSAQRICSLLLPSTAAIAIAITDDRFILGYAGYEESHNLSGSIIRTHATYSTLSDGKTRVLFTPEEIGFPKGTHGINAAIIVPLTVGKDVKGTLKFYYPPCEPHQRNPEVHRHRFRPAAVHADGGIGARGADCPGHQDGAQDAPKPDQPALPVQHHQHHRFVHAHRPCTRPYAAARVREVLPQHARGFRRPDRVLAASSSRPSVTSCSSWRVSARTVWSLICDVEPEVEDMMVPPFLIQPLVENAVRHAMPSEGKLTIRVEGVRQGDDVIVVRHRRRQRHDRRRLATTSFTLVPRRAAALPWATYTTASAAISAPARIWKWKASSVRAPRCVWC